MRAVVGGLFCPRIFGPEEDNRCRCGHLEGPRHAGQVCEKCGVEVTTSSVRRERFGHIELAAPVVNPLFTTPDTVQYLALVLGLEETPVRGLLDRGLRLVTGVDYLHVVEILDTPTVLSMRDEPRKRIEELASRLQILTEGGLLDESEQEEIDDSVFAEAVRTETGSAAISNLLASIDLESEIQRLNQRLTSLPAVSMDAEKLCNRLDTLESLLRVGLDSADLVISALPVLPAGLRPVVSLDRGRVGIAPVNELYRLVLSRNQRLRQLETLNAPRRLLESAEFLLEDAVAALFHNGGESPVELGHRRASSLLDNLSDTLLSLFARRLDYSASAHCCVDSSLAADEVVLPLLLAEELFESHSKAAAASRGEAVPPRSRAESNRDTSDVCEGIGSYVMAWRGDRLPPAFVGLRVTGAEGNVIRVSPEAARALGADGKPMRVRLSLPLALPAQAETAVLMHPALADESGLEACCGRLRQWAWLLQASATGERVPSLMSSAELLHALDAGVIELTELVELRIPAESHLSRTTRLATTAARVLVSQRLELAVEDVTSLEELLAAAARRGRGALAGVERVLVQVSQLSPSIAEASLTGAPPTTALSRFHQAHAARRRRATSNGVNALLLEVARQLYRTSISDAQSVWGRDMTVLDSIRRAAGCFLRAAGLGASRLGGESLPAAVSLAHLLWGGDAPEMLAQWGEIWPSPNVAIVAPFAGEITISETEHQRVVMLTSGYLDEKTWLTPRTTALAPGIRSGTRVAAGARIIEGIDDWRQLLNLLSEDSVREQMSGSLSTLLSALGVEEPQWQAIVLTSLLTGWVRIKNTGGLVDHLDRGLLLRRHAFEELRLSADSGSARPTAVAVVPSLSELSTESTGIAGLADDVLSLARAAIGISSGHERQTEIVNMLSGGIPKTGTGAIDWAEIAVRGDDELLRERLGAPPVVREKGVLEDERLGTAVLEGFGWLFEM